MSPIVSSTFPTDIDSVTKLDGVPECYKTGDVVKPLRFVDENGQVRLFVLNPMHHAVYILSIEVLERFGYYGLNFTVAAFLMGLYSDSADWNPGFSAVRASSDTSLSIFIAYASAFVGAYLADHVVGDYWAVIIGVLVFYVPGLLLIFLSTVPGLLGSTFNTPVFLIAFLGLWPLGTGIIKSVVNVFGAKQYHPILQESLVETYYINFYMCINIGAVGGGLLIPVLAQYNIQGAYAIPVVVLALGCFIFLLGSPRYVHTEPQRKTMNVQTPTQAELNRKDSGSSNQQSNGRNADTEGETTILEMLGLTGLIIPFNIMYYQLTTTYIVQGAVMTPAWGFVDAQTLNNMDSFSVLFHGFLVGTYLYPYLSKKQIRFSTTQKYAVGSLLGLCSIGWILIVDYAIIRQFNATGEPLSVLWQTPAYVLCGAGEIFTIAATFEVAFRTASTRNKAMASAVNLFLIGGVPNALCVLLYSLCESFFLNAAGTGNISTLKLYTEAHVCWYFWIIVFLMIGGILLNLAPPVQRWVAGIETRASKRITQDKIHREQLLRRDEGIESNERSGLLRHE